MVNPQDSTENAQTWTRDNGYHRCGCKIDHTKCDELRAAGKCSQCEETGHDQRNCPKLHSVRRPTVNVTNIELARRQRMAQVRNSQDVHVGIMSVKGVIDYVDDAMDSMRQVYDLCSPEWGSDDCWN